VNYLVYYCFDRTVHCFEYFVDIDQDCYNFDIVDCNLVGHLHYCSFGIVDYLMNLSNFDTVGYYFVDYHNYIDY